jgi:hypothetical protein
MLSSQPPGGEFPCAITGSAIQHACITVESSISAGGAYPVAELPVDDLLRPVARPAVFPRLRRSPTLAVGPCSRARVGTGSTLTLQEWDA